MNPCSMGALLLSGILLTVTAFAEIDNGLSPKGNGRSLNATVGKKSTNSSEFLNSFLSQFANEGWTLRANDGSQLLSQFQPCGAFLDQRKYAAVGVSTSSFSQEVRRDAVELLGLLSLVHPILTEDKGVFARSQSTQEVDQTLHLLNGLLFPRLSFMNRGDDPTNYLQYNFSSTLWRSDRRKPGSLFLQFNDVQKHGESWAAINAVFDEGSTLEQRARRNMNRLLLTLISWSRLKQIINQECLDLNTGLCELNGRLTVAPSTVVGMTKYNGMKLNEVLKLNELARKVLEGGIDLQSNALLRLVAIGMVLVEDSLNERWQEILADKTRGKRFFGLKDNVIGWHERDLQDRKIALAVESTSMKKIRGILAKIMQGETIQIDNLELNAAAGESFSDERLPSMDQSFALMRAADVDFTVLRRKIDDLKIAEQLTDLELMNLSNQMANLQLSLSSLASQLTPLIRLNSLRSGMTLAELNLIIANTLPTLREARVQALESLELAQLVQEKFVTMVGRMDQNAVAGSAKAQMIYVDFRQELILVTQISEGFSARLQVLQEQVRVLQGLQTQIQGIQIQAQLGKDVSVMRLELDKHLDGLDGI